MYFLFYVLAFDDAIKLKNLKLRTKRAFEVKYKTFFVISQVLSFTLKKTN